MSDKVPFPIGQIFPIFQIMTQVNFFCRPKAGFGLFIELPYILMCNGEEYEPVFVFLENRFLVYRLGHAVKFLFGVPAMNGCQWFELRYEHSEQIFKTKTNIQRTFSSIEMVIKWLLTKSSMKKSSLSFT